MELVVLVDEYSNPIGTAPKSEVHTTTTPLHLAFSCHVRNVAGNVLVTRRALTKKTWPGVWTNSFCGHPSPGEDVEEAVNRRAATELGFTVRGIELIVPQYRYRAVDSSGVVENEICPVYSAIAVDDPHPSPAEVCEWAWVDPSALGQAMRAAPFTFSPWLVEQASLIPWYRPR